MVLRNSDQMNSEMPMDSAEVKRSAPCRRGLRRLYAHGASAMSFRLAFKWVGQLYLVGQMQDLTDCAAKGIADKVSDILKEVDLAEGCVSVLKPFMGKAAEGAGNAYLVYRLGRCAIREFAILKD